MILIGQGYHGLPPSISNYGIEVYTGGLFLMPNSFSDCLLTAEEFHVAGFHSTTLQENIW